ncbi:MAG: propionyl-CoA carboxylase, partial [Deltaproteobacteria bacterium]|nr:propionyl-CoA carboxylase [Deltaproteobacteria bacterium]
MSEWMNGFMDQLAANRKENLEGGGQAAIALQHELGKMTARERIDYLVDEGTFVELGSRTRDPRNDLGELTKPSPSDGVVMGAAEISGRQVMVYAMDFTVMSGSLGEQGVWKMAELVKMA